MIYLIGGPPRAGKTTLAKQLAKKLKTSWISADVFDAIAKAYTDKENIEKNFPYSYLRGHGNARNNDEFYSVYSSKKIVSVLKREAKSVEKAIETFIAHELADHTSWVIEGYHITPAFVSKIEKKYRKDNVRTIFLVKNDPEKFSRDVYKSTTPNDWLLAITKKKETFFRVGQMVSLYSSFISEQAKKYGYRIFEMDIEFKKKLKEIVVYFSN